MTPRGLASRGEAAVALEGDGTRDHVTSVAVPGGEVNSLRSARDVSDYAAFLRAGEAKP